MTKMPQKAWVVIFDGGYAPSWVSAVFLDKQEAENYAGDAEALIVEEFEIGTPPGEVAAGQDQSQSTPIPQ